MNYLLYFLALVGVWLVSMLVLSYLDYRHQWMVKTHGSRAPPSFWAWLFMQYKFATRQKKAEAGEINLAGVLMMGIGMIFLSIGFIMLPIMTDATSTILAYVYSSCSSITDATYTGYTSVVGITPLLVLVGFLVEGVVVGFLGFKVFHTGGTSASAALNPGTLILLALSIVFIAISLIIEPVMLDGVSSVVYGGGSGISASFTGFSPLVHVAPMLVHIGFLAAAVFTGFFGIRNLSKASA